MLTTPDFLVYNDPSFNIDAFATEKGERLVRQHGVEYQIVEEKGDPADSSQTTADLDWHMDGLYLQATPKYALLHCLHPGTENIPTDFADLQLVRLSDETRAVLNTLRVNYRSRHHTTHTHDLMGINLATRAWVDFKPEIEIKALPTLRETTMALTELFAELDCLTVRHTWQRGDVVIWDNHRYVHRRISGKLDLERKLHRLWFN